MGSVVADFGEQAYRLIDRLTFAVEDVASKLAESAPSASTNNAMVPCPHFQNERTCPIRFNAICGIKPCLIQRAQHQ